MPGIHPRCTGHCTKVHCLREGFLYVKSNFLAFFFVFHPTLFPFSFLHSFVVGRRVVLSSGWLASYSRSFRGSCINNYNFLFSPSNVSKIRTAKAPSRASCTRGAHSVEREQNPSTVLSKVYGVLSPVPPPQPIQYERKELTKLKYFFLLFFLLVLLGVCASTGFRISRQLYFYF